MIGLESDGDLGVLVLRSGRICLFLHDKLQLEKDEFMRAVRCGKIERWII